MTREEFQAKYRPRFLLFVVDAWAIRHQEPSSLGLALDQHHLMLSRLLDAMYHDLTKQPADPVNNGRPQPKGTP